MAQPAVRRAKPRDKAVPLHDDRTQWDKALDVFFAECRRRNHSASTLQNYHYYLRGVRMTAFIEDHGITSPAEFDKEMLETFEGELFAAEGGLAATTVHTFHRILKNFLRFTQERGLGGDPRIWTGGKKGHGEVAAPKLPEKQKPHYSDAEIAALRKHLKERPRDLMLVNFMLATGLRLAEVCDTTLDDIDWDDPRGITVRVRQGKGRKDRNVPLDTKSNKVSGQLRRYLKDRPESVSNALFLTNRKDGGDYLPLSSNAVQTLFKRMSDDTGIHINPHKFRHTLGFQMARDGVSPMVMMKVFGHTSITMSAEYVSYDTGDLLAAWNQRP